MIGWCMSCLGNPVDPVDDGECSDCFMAGTEGWNRNTYAFRMPVDEIHYVPPSYSLSELFDGSEKLWEQRTPKIVYNTVDLAELRQLRDDWRDIGFDW